jgi:hypothetical protein
MLIVSGFRNATQESRLADGVSATVTATTTAISMGHGWNYQCIKQ